MSILSPMFATQFKLTKAGELTRRVTFPEPPTWTTLASKIESIYGIPQEQLAVSYVDKDKDEITLNSNDELLDFFLNCHKRGDLVKFSVVDLGSLRAARGTTTKAQDINVGNNDSSNAVSSSMLFDDIFGVPPFPAFARADHAYVEVIDDDDDDDHMVGNSLQGLFDGMVEGKEMVDRTTNNSSVSVIENETPHKPLVHVYDLSDRDNDFPSPILLTSPRTPKAELGASLRQSPMIPPVIPISNPFEFIKSSEYGNFTSDGKDGFSALADDIGKPLPKIPSTRTQRASMTSTPPPVIATISESPRAPPVIVTVSGSTPTTYTPKFGDHMYDDPPVIDIYPDPVQPSTSNDHNLSLIKDVADLIEVFSSAVSISPDLSNKLRDIVRNAEAGKYWPSDLTNVSNATHSGQNAKADSSGQFQRSSNDSRTVEHDAAERVTAVLGRIFGTIREVVKGITDFNSRSDDHENNAERNISHSHIDEMLFNGTHEAPSNAPTHASGTWPPSSANLIPPAPPLIIPPPPIFNGTLPRRPAHIPTEQGYSERLPYLPGSSFSVQKPLYTGPNAGTGILSNTGTQDPLHHGMAYGSFSPMYSAGNPNSYKNIPDISNLRGNEGQFKSDPHEKKAQLEAAKAYYRAEKKRFRMEKEQRRKRRRGVEEKMVEEGKARKAVDETVVARIPLGKSAEKRMAPFYAEVYRVSRPSQVRDISTKSEHIVPKQINKETSKVTLERAVLARLADMGFRPSSHHDIPALLQAYIHLNSELTKENEDNLVTRIMQVLLTND